MIKIMVIMITKKEMILIIIKNIPTKIIIVIEQQQ